MTTPLILEPWAICRNTIRTFPFRGRHHHHHHHHNQKFSPSANAATKCCFNRENLVSNSFWMMLRFGHYFLQPAESSTGYLALAITGKMLSWRKNTSSRQDVCAAGHDMSWHAKSNSYVIYPRQATVNGDFELVQMLFFHAFCISSKSRTWIK